MTPLILVVGAIVGTALAVAITGLVGAARATQTPARHRQPFDRDTERAIVQALAVQDQPIYMAGVIDELAKRRIRTAQ